MFFARCRPANAFLIVLLATLTAQAQSGRTSAGSSPQMEGSAEDPQARVFRPAWRRIAEEHGFTLSLSDIYDFMGNPVGGNQQTARPIIRSVAVLHIDLEQAVRWRGADLYASGMYQTGSTYTQNAVGAYDHLSSVQGTHSLRFDEYYLSQHFFAKKLLIRAGEIAPQAEFANQTIGFNNITSSWQTWVNNTLAANSLIFNQLYLAYPPAGKPGLLVQVEPTKHYYAKAGVFSAPHSVFVGDPSGTRFDLRNAPDMAAEVGWKQGDEDTNHPGVYKAGIVRNFGTFTRLDSGPSTHGDNVYFIAAAQDVWRVKDAAGAFTARGVSAQFSVAATSRSINENDNETAGGLRFLGLVPGRRNDIAGLGLIYAHFSRDWSQQLVTKGLLDRTSQTNLEASYKFVVRRWVSIWPDFQYVWKPSGDRLLHDTPVFDLRLVFDH